jgi:hypothetical protein
MDLRRFVYSFLPCLELVRNLILSDGIAFGLIRLCNIYARVKYNSS